MSFSRTLSVIIVLFYCSIIFGQIESEIIEPWEEDLKPTNKNDGIELPKFISSPIDYFYSDLIGFYQSKISSNSIHRCPFHISCSHYTKEAIRKYGAYTGILHFIDRNLFRENIAMKTHYSFRKKDNKFKLDDSYYLFFLGNKHEK